VTCQCIFFVEWEIHVQVTPLDRPLPPGEGRGEVLLGDIRLFDFFTPLGVPKAETRRQRPSLGVSLSEYSRKGAKNAKKGIASLRDLRASA